MSYNLEKIPIVMKPVIPETLKKIAHGKSCRFRARELGTLQSVQNAIYRLNNNGENFIISEVINNGEMYIITRN